MKNPLIPAGIKPATFRFVAQLLNHCATAVPGACYYCVELPHWSIVLGSTCVGVSVWLCWSGIRVAGLSTTCASACNTDTTPTQPHRNSNIHQTKNNTTNMVIQQNSLKLLSMGILMSETC